MAMNLRLTDEDSEALRNYAAEHGMSMQQAAVDGIRQMLHGERRARFIQHILDEDRELLHRLAQ
jgi:plasmid stability protein